MRSTEYAEFTLAAVQAESIPFDVDASTDQACHLIEAAADQHATLAAFGETWLPGYPFFALQPPPRRCGGKQQPNIWPVQWKSPARQPTDCAPPLVVQVLTL